MFENPAKATIALLSAGNPGCMQLLLEIVQTAPNDFVDIATTMARYRLTGVRAHMLWNDACGRDTRAVIELFHKIRAGRLPIKTVEEHLGQGWCRPFTADEENKEAKAWNESQEPANP